MTGYCETYNILSTLDMYDMSVPLTLSSDPSGLRIHVQVLNPNHFTQWLGPIADRHIPLGIRLQRIFHSWDADVIKVLPLAGISFEIVLGIKDSGVIFAEEGEVVIPKELDDSNGTRLIARNFLCERLPADVSHGGEGEENVADPLAVDSATGADAEGLHQNPGRATIG
jgi:hypothetical protein